MRKTLVATQLKIMEPEISVTFWETVEGDFQKNQMFHNNLDCFLLHYFILWILYKAYKFKSS